MDSSVYTHTFLETWMVWTTVSRLNCRHWPSIRRSTAGLWRPVSQPLCLNHMSRDKMFYRSLKEINLKYHHYAYIFTRQTWQWRTPHMQYSSSINSFNLPKRWRNRGNSGIWKKTKKPVELALAGFLVLVLTGEHRSCSEHPQSLLRRARAGDIWKTTLFKYIAF